MAEQAKEMTAAEAAKAVRRTVVGKDGASKQVAVRAEEVLSFKDYGKHLVVVTRDGQKLSSADAKGAETEA